MSTVSVEVFLFGCVDMGDLHISFTVRMRLCFVLGRLYGVLRVFQLCRGELQHVAYNMGHRFQTAKQQYF
jgi:ribosomal protein S14